MREEVLRRFFEGKCSAAELALDVAGSARREDVICTVVTIEDMKQPFTVTADMGIRLCDAVLQGELPPDALETIGFALISSEAFQWDGEQDDVLANVIADWSCPEVNYPLTRENVGRCRDWLARAAAYPERPAVTSSGELIKVTKKKKL